MGLPFTKTVTLRWDGTHWREMETGVLVVGIAPLHGSWPGKQDDAPSQEGHHPFDKSFYVTYEQVEKIISDAIEARTADVRQTVRHYFAPAAETLITYEYLRETVGILNSEQNALERRLFQLENHGGADG